MGQSASKAVSNPSTKKAVSQATSTVASSVRAAAPTTNNNKNRSNATPSKSATISTQNGNEDADNMNSDLLQFLQDSGPVKPPPEASTPHTKKPTSGQRTVESMRLAENVPGFDTNRTTNFSHRVDTDEEFRLDVVQFYPLLRASSIEEFYQQQQQQQGGDSTAASRTSDVENLLNAAKYLELPILMRDVEDNSYIGIHPDRIPPMLEETSPAQVKLVIQDLWEIEQKGDEKQSSNT